MNSARNRARAGRRNTYLAAVATAFLAIAMAPGPATADQIENPVAVFAALDKVTARIKPLAIKIGATAEFGA
ncbi:MAG: DUF2155 domain-containing protein, partial [Hyphomicrobiales bacterium]|nr:DUF2155 domain-containing protein [Hyphomicrobiales bacterium]